MGRELVLAAGLPAGVPPRRPGAGRAGRRRGQPQRVRGRSTAVRVARPPRRVPRQGGDVPRRARLVPAADRAAPGPAGDRRPAAADRRVGRPARRRAGRGVPGGHPHHRGGRGGAGRGGVAGPDGRRCRPAGRLPGHGPAGRQRATLAAAGGRAGGGAARAPVRWWPGRAGGGHRDRPGRTGPADRRARRGTERHVSEDHRLLAGTEAAELGFDVDAEVAPAPPAPVLAVVGRPNVGKSTLVNRLIGRREAVVQDVPGVTRDRVAYDAAWNGRRFTLVDTGGWEPDATGLQAVVAAQAEYAMRSADAVLLVVDATVGATATDEAVARVLRKSDVPVLLAATKVDDDRLVSDTAALWRLGLGQPYPVSGLHGRNAGDLLDAILAALPESPRELLGAGEGGPRRVALIGKPNVGKSSLLNRVSGEVRSVVHEVAGTTVDPVDSLVELDGEVWRFVDTAGLRKRVKTASGMEYYASLRTQAAIEAAEVALVLLDASEPIAEQDQRVISMVEEAGRALVLVFNKWDLVDEDRRLAMRRELERDLVRVPWAERVNVSALTGRAIAKIAPTMRTALASWDRRVSTGQLNSWLSEVVAATPPPVRGGKQPKILFATQASTRPPTFVLFTSGFLEAGYRRFLERRLREEFGFAGSPIRISVRVREKRERR